MEDINRLLILLLLVGLLYVIYKYQHLIFTKERFNTIENLIYNNTPNFTQPQSQPQIEQNKVSTDNISQLSINSLEDGERPAVYKPDSVLGSLDDGSLFISDAGSQKSQKSLVSDDGSLFF